MNRVVVAFAGLALLALVIAVLFPLPAVVPPSTGTAMAARR